MTNDPTATDPVTELANATWALAAVIATQRGAAQGSLAEALAADPDRTAVLVAAGLVHPSGGGFVPDPVLHEGPAADNAASARLSSLRQAVDVAEGRTADGWDSQSDQVLLEQGRASAGIGHAIATSLAPTLPGLAGRLAGQGSRVLDVGAGVAALSLALARALPHVRVTAVDVLDRAITLARNELAQAGEAAERVELRHQDIADLREPNTYDLVWLPAPFLAEDAMDKALPHLVNAMVPGGWLVVGTNPTPTGDLATAVARWNAIRNGGNSQDANRMAETLAQLGLAEVNQHPTVPGGPILITGQRPGR